MIKLFSVKAGFPPVPRGSRPESAMLECENDFRHLSVFIELVWGHNPSNVMANLSRRKSSKRRQQLQRDA